MADLKISKDYKIHVDIKNGSIQNFEYVKSVLKETGAWELVGGF